MLFDELEEGTDESSNDYYSAEDEGDVTYSIDDRRGRKRKKKRVKKKTKSLQGFKLASKKGIDIVMYNLPDIKKGCPNRDCLWKKDTAKMC